MKIVLFFGSNIRSGANLCLLRHAAFLSGCGHQVELVLQYPFFDKDISFVPGTSGIAIHHLADYTPGPTPADVAITNWWQCAFDFDRLPARAYVYYRHGDEKALYTAEVAGANATHAFDILIDAVLQENFHWVCVSPPLVAELRELGQQAWLLPNGVDVARFAGDRPSLPPRRGALRVLVEGPVSAAFKRVEATVAALRRVAGIEIVHMAADGSKPAVAVDHALGAVDHDDTARVYAACDLIVRLAQVESFAMPVLEQFAAGGTAVVTAFPGHDSYINAANAVIVPLDDPFDAAVAAVIRLRDAPGVLADLKAAATRTAQAYDWRELHRHFAAVLSDLEAASPPRPQRLAVMDRGRASYRDILALWMAAAARA